MRIAFSKLSNWQLTLLIFGSLVLLSAGIVMIFAAPYLTTQNGTIEIVNASGESISDVSVNVGKTAFNTGAMMPGRSISFTYKIYESAIDLDIQFASGRHHKLQNIGYIDCFEQTDVAVVKANTVELTTRTILPFSKQNKHGSTHIYSMNDTPTGVHEKSP